MTLLMTWMTPLSTSMSAFTTLAPFTLTPAVPTSKRTLLPSRVVASMPLVSADDITLPDTTWNFRMLLSVGRSSSCCLLSLSAPSAATNASLVGANTVNGPGPLSADARLACAGGGQRWQAARTEGRAL